MVETPQAQDARERFTRILKAAATITETQLNDDVVAIYLLAISKDPGLEVAIKGMMSLFGEMKPGRGFPSIDDIRNVCLPPDKKLLPEDLARDASAKAVGAVAKFGWSNPEKAREHMGELAWRAVDRIGGWTNFCETLSTNNATTMQAQLRDLCSSLLAKDKAGIPDPDALRLAQSDPSKGLVANLVSELVSKTECNSLKNTASMDQGNR